MNIDKHYELKKLKKRFFEMNNSLHAKMNT